MRSNTTKAKLKAGDTVFGCFVRYPSASLIGVLRYWGWDFLVFDGEHGTLEPSDCENMVRAAELHDVTPVVRVTSNQPPIILRLMDTGAQGLHIPWVNSAAEAEAAVRAVKYYPRGIRGLASVRASQYGQTVSFDNYVRQANAETLVVVQVETAEAAENIPEIVAIDDVDVIFIGPTDLSHSLGFPGQLEHPRVQQTMHRIVQDVARSDKALGIFVGSADAARHWRRRGARYITIGLEAVLGPAVRQYLRSAQA